MSTVETRIAEVLAAVEDAHQFKKAEQMNTDYPHFWCSCGVQTIGRGKFPEHVRQASAAALAPVIREAQAEAWDACVHAADKQWTIGHTSAQLLRNTNPYGADKLDTL